VKHLKPALQLVPGQSVHFIGIGGSGLSAIARILLLQGYQVSGSDLRHNSESEGLKSLGATLFQGHDAAYVNGSEFVIATSAVKDEHVEILSAQAQGIPVYRRFDIMNAIMDGSIGIAIAGTHGKTTTTSMVAHILKQTGQDPTYIVGGVMANTGTNADVGSGKAFVIEADEYGNMFLGLKPQIQVITSVEYDHPDFFESPSQLVESFSGFIALLPDDGLLIACANDMTAQIFARNRQVVGLPTATYGIDTLADWRAVNIHYEGGITLYELEHENEILGTVALPVPGRHNILNSLAALIVAYNQDVSLLDAIDALSTFKGAGRRFDVRSDSERIAIIDDYAHHPTAIKTTIDAALQRYPERELWAVWQPHTFSRTQALWDDYLSSFTEAHHVLVTDIYAAREADNPEVNSANFVNELVHPSKFHTPSLDEAVELLATYVQSEAVILIMSAGDAPQIGINFLKMKANSR
jgi:UDP-N-acetylmuramate--alanine ligase